MTCMPFNDKIVIYYTFPIVQQNYNSKFPISSYVDKKKTEKPFKTINKTQK